jgi:hypothetical protein
MWCFMRSEIGVAQHTMTGITGDLGLCSVEWLYLRQPRLEGISSRYWAPFETRSQGLVSSGSSTLLPSTVLRSEKTAAAVLLAQDAISRPANSLTAARDRSNLAIVSQTACQLLACSELSKGSGMTNRSLSTFLRLKPDSSNLRWTSPNNSGRRLSVSAQEIV